jgi:colicin import membrane protein
MRTDWFQTSRSLFFSIILHIILGGILIFSFKFSAKPTPVHKPVTNIVQATSVDKKQVELELKRLKDKEEAKKAEEKKRQKKLEKKAEEAKKKRIAEEKKLKKLKKKKKEEKKKRIAEEKKLKKLKKEKKELEKKQKLEREKKKKEAERKRKEEEKLKAEEAERKRKEEEKKLKEKALQEELEAEQSEHDQSEILKFTSLIKHAIENKFNETNLKEGLSCKIIIRMSEGGKVIESAIVESSGNELFDQRAEKAVYSASPLPVPSESRLFNKMRSIRITFDP